MPSASPPVLARVLHGLLPALWLLCAAPAQAQPVKPAWPQGSMLALSATDIADQPLAPERLRQQVVVVFVWSTGCAVCRDSLPELRANAAGWRNKPFTLLAVNVDPQAGDWTRYETLLGKTQMPGKNWQSVRLTGALPTNQRLPLTLLVAPGGKILQRFEGRLAPEVWDTVADLLP